MKKDEERIKKAKAINKALRAMYNQDFYILLRTNGEYGGIVFDITKMSIRGEMRTIYKAVSPKGKITTEFGDYKIDGTLEPQDVRAIIFRKVPVILTQRLVPGIEDSEENFLWLVTEEDAHMLSNWRNEANKKQMEIHELNSLVNSLRKSNEFLENKVSILAEENRKLNRRISDLSQENTHLKTALATLNAKLNQYIVSAYSTDEALKHVLSHVDTLGKRGGTVMDDVLKTLEMEKKLREKKALADAVGRNDMSINEIQKLKMENQKLREEIESLKKLISSNHNKEEVKAEAT